MDAREFFDAVARGDLAAVRALLARSPELARARDATGATALHYATFAGRRDLAELLLAHGADVNARDAEHGATPSGWAIEYLREHGGLLGIEIADVLFAIRRGDVELARRLLTRLPALLTAVDPAGVPLRRHAELSGDPELARLFDPR